MSSKYDNFDVFLNEFKKRYPSSLLTPIKEGFKGIKGKCFARCSKHGLFEVRSDVLLYSGCGCKKCRYEKVSCSLTKPKEDFILKATELYHGTYCYDRVQYKNLHTKVEVVCKEHGSFFITPINHLKGHKCPTCALVSRGLKRRSTKENFIKKAHKVHGNEYDYSLVVYTTNTSKVKIRCYKHGVFEQQPNNHLQGQGCPKCKKSKAESYISSFLKRINISFKEQYVIDGCRYKNLLPFDFAIFNEDGSLKYLIEYQGEQHFVPFRFKDGDKKFNIRQERDKIKKDYCKEHHIPLYYITYKDNIEDKLKEFLEIKDAF